MSEKTVHTVRLVYGILLSVLLCMTGVLLIIGCVSIYQSGPRPFTPESISAAFAKIQVPVYMTLGVLLVGIILHLALPREKEKAKITVDKKVILRRLEKRLAQAGIDPVPPTVKRERLLRRVLWVVAFLCCAATFIPAALYVFDPAHFTLTSFNEDTAAAALRIIPAFLVSSAIITAMIYAERAACAMEIQHAKKALAQAPKNNAIPTPDEGTDNDRTVIRRRVVLGIRLALLVVGVTFIVLGIFNGGMADVLYKAVNICTECIGLG